MSVEEKSGYKLTEAGVLPKDWALKSGQEITQLISKGSSPKWQGFKYCNDGMLFITSENVRDGYLDISQPKFLPLEFHEKLSRTKLLQNDILLNLVGASIGRSCRIRQPIDNANINQAVAVFRLKDLRNAAFIEYFFQAPITVKRILDMQADAARPNISLGNLRQFLLPLPPPKEQVAIATALSDTDALISGLDQLIAKKRDIKQATMQQLLTGQTRLPGFSGEWEVRRLGEVAALKSGYSFKSSTYTEFGNYKVVTIANVQDGYMSIDECNKIASIPDDIQIHQRLYRDDILISMTGNVGRVCRVTSDDCLLNQRVGKLVPLSISDNFIFHVVSQRRFLVSMGTKAKGGAQGNLSVSDITEFEFSAPSEYAEQIAIAAALSDIETELTTLEASREKARQLKQGMMQELLTGRIRLT